MITQSPIQHPLVFSGPAEHSDTQDARGHAWHCPLQRMQDTGGSTYPVLSWGSPGTAAAQAQAEDCQTGWYKSHPGKMSRVPQPSSAQLVQKHRFPVTARRRGRGAAHGGVQSMLALSGIYNLRSAPPRPRYNLTNQGGRFYPWQCCLEIQLTFGSYQVTKVTARKSIKGQILMQKGK